MTSFETSFRYRSNDEKQWNKKIIDKVYENEKETKKNNLWNMSFCKRIGYFILKNELDSNFEFNEFKFNLEKFTENNNEIYFSR